MSLTKNLPVSGTAWFLHTQPVHMADEITEFEVLGYSEELLSVVTNKKLGSRPIVPGDRPVGSPGIRYFDLTEKTVLSKNGRTVVINASPKRPVKVMSVIIAICGRRKTPPNTTQ